MPKGTGDRNSSVEQMTEPARRPTEVSGRLLLQLAIVAIAGFGLGSCAHDEVSVEPAPTVPPYSGPSRSVSNIITVGDTLELFVLEDAAFNGNYKVREKGDIILPKVGRISVSGLSPETAQEKVKGVLESSQLKSASVILDRVQKAGLREFSEVPKMLVFITGKVARPGQHMVAIENGSRVYAYEAILIAGGTSPFADEQHSYILRRGASGARTKIPLNIRAIRQGSGTDVALMEGDMIVVPERRFAL